MRSLKILVGTFLVSWIVTITIDAASGVGIDDKGRPNFLPPTLLAIGMCLIVWGLL